MIAFQSHYGLILSICFFWTKRRERRSFQSHYGLILSIWARSLLSGAGVNLSIPLWSDFIVRKMEELEIIEINFQSHYGLILSNFRRGQNGKRNSHFQSHYGLILSQSTTSCKCGAFHPFNPTMVWFYHMRRETRWRIKNDFQSHYGLILSSLKISFVPIDWRLSIPLWSDFIIRKPK